MSSEDRFKYYRYAEEQAFLKWKRTCVRGRQVELAKGLADLDMPPWKKRRLIREVIFYSSRSDFQPLTGLGVYDYETEESNDRSSDAASYNFEMSSTVGSPPVTESSVRDSTSGTPDAGDRSPTSRTSGLGESSLADTEVAISEERIAKEQTNSERTGSSPVASFSINDSTTGAPEAADKSSTSRTSGLVESPVAELVNELVDKSTTSRTSGLVESPVNESEFVTFEECTASEEQTTPERTRRFEDYNAGILQLSPALSALKISHNKTLEKSEAADSIKDLVKNPNVRFLKLGKFHTSQRGTLPFSLIYNESRTSNEVTTSEPLDHAEIDSSMMILVPSNVQPEVQQLILKFAEQFNCGWMECDAIEGSFDERVSHVIVDLEVSQPLQFAQCQAIGCRRYLVSADWLRDSLDAGRVLSEDPFELIMYDEKTGENVATPSELARLSSKSLFDGFTFLLCRPFRDFKESQMQRLLIMNGAQVCSDPRQLIHSSDQAWVCIVDSKFYRKGKNRMLLKQKSLKYKFVAVHYEWLFHSLLMYELQPLLRYLHDAKPEEALEAGVLEEFLEE